MGKRQSAICRQVAAMLAKARGDSGLSRERLGWLADLTDETITNYERLTYTGHKLRHVADLARALRRRLVLTMEPFEELGEQGSAHDANGE